MRLTDGGGKKEGVRIGSALVAFMSSTTFTKARFEMPSISKAIAAMDKACRIWSIGYDQSNRWDIRNGGECDCSSLVIWALRQGGFATGGDKERLEATST